MNEVQEEIERGERFPFGENWRRFLDSVDEDRIAEAERSFREALGLQDLNGARFLDVGCGSGLFSLAAHRLGALVYSFDFDPASIACTAELKLRWADESDTWTIHPGSALDRGFMSSLGEFDVVYSWGVLHHTGDMDTALSNVTLPVAPRGRLYIALYNDQGWKSKFWLRIKQLFCRNRWGRALVIATFVPAFFAIGVAGGIKRDGRPWSRFTQYHRDRGMSIHHDWIDWLGGLPFETTSVHEITTRFERLGFETLVTTTTAGWGCNEFVLRAPGVTQPPE